MKRNSILLSTCCAVLLMLAGPACSQASQDAEAGAKSSAELELEEAQKTWHAAAAEVTRDHLRSVAARGDARSLLAAAMLWPQWPADEIPGNAPPFAQERRAWFEAARNASPRDPLVAWMEASDCGGLSDSCDREGALERLLQAEPDNAAVHLLAIAAADRSGAEQTAEQHWQAAAASTAYDPHALKISQLLYAAMEDAVLPPLTPALAQSMGRQLGSNRDATPEDLRDVVTMAVWAAVAIPAYRTPTRMCVVDESAPLPAQRAAQCRRVMTMLATDQTVMIGHMIGLKNMAELTAGSAEGAAWREKLRQFHWVYERAQDSMQPSATSTLPRGYLEWVMLEGELPAMRRLLEANGIQATAPEGWLPRKADVRALLESANAKT